MRAVVGWLLVAWAGGLLALVAALAQPRPVTVQDQVGAAHISLSAERQWVTFPAECVEVTYTLQNVQSATFYPQIERGIEGGRGTRSVFLSRIYAPGQTIEEDAPGGITEHFADPSETVTRSGTGCLDYGTEPKLRVTFADGSSRAYTLGLDVLFLRVETWLLILGALACLIAAGMLLGWPETLRPERLLLWTSTALLLLYAVLFAHHPRFFSIYWLDSVLFAVLLGATVGLSVYSVLRPRAFDQLMPRLRTRVFTPPGVFVMWVWLLAFAYSMPQAGLFSEVLWLPLLMWAAVAGLAVLWGSRPSAGAAAPALASRRTAVLIALIFAALSLARDAALFRVYSVILANDTPTYIHEGRDFLAAGTSSGLPKRIFPYLAVNFVTQSWQDPAALVALQAAVGAAAVGLLVYVLARERVWLGVGVGLLLVLNLAWATYNRAILTEGLFVSFHVLCFAILLWHAQRRQTLRLWEIFAFGMLCGWTLLFRGTGLPLIVPIALIYAFLTRGITRPLALLAGFAVFLLAVGLYNQWRYDEFGLVGPQDDTLVSSLFSYHLFSPENGPTSARIDAALRECMGYLDYDDVPRYINNFIYGHYNLCLVPQWGQAEVTAATSQAFRELVLRRPFAFARVLILEAGTGLKVAIPVMFALHGTEDGLSNPGVCETVYTDCNRFTAQPVPGLAAVLTTLNNATTYPGQLYLAVDQVSSASDVVILSAFLMLSGTLWMLTRHKLMVLVGVGFVLYQLLAVSAAHVFIPRYGLILAPFLAVLSVLGAGTALAGIRRVRLRGTPVIVGLILVSVLYVGFANTTLRRMIAAPTAARAGINLIEKYGIGALDFSVYQALQAEGAAALYPEAQNWRYHPLSSLQAVYHPFELDAAAQDRFAGWRFTRLPGYLRDVGASHLLLDGQQWSALPPEDQAVLMNQAHYRLVGEWTAEGDSRRLFAVVGDARGVFPAYDRNGIVVFEQPDRSLDVYRLDANRNGVFIVRIDPTLLAQGQLDYSGEAGWSARLEPRTEKRYRMIVLDANQEPVDRGFVLRLP